jgi:uncharacterized protein (TIGR02246 family)
MTLGTRDVEAIRLLVEKDAEAVRQSDWTTVAGLFTEDAVRFPPHRAPVRGREAIRAWLETFPTIEQFEITADEILGCDDFAFVRGTYRVIIRPDVDAEPLSDRGNYFGLVRRQADGSWLWATDMISSELPAASPGA